MESISVVITCHNNIELTKACIDAVLVSNRMVDEIIVVDNASSDGTPELIATYGDYVKYVRREVNDGSIIGRNIGIKCATGDRVLVLDNDQIVSPDTIDNYLKYDEDLVGAELRKCDVHGVGYPIYTKHEHPRVYLGIGGLMIKRRVFDGIGFLDEDFSPAYCDDPDFFWRAVDAGFTWNWLPENRILHVAHSTLDGGEDIDRESAYKRSHELLRSKYPERFKKLDKTQGNPLVSYVIPTFNRAHLIGQCLDSILAQTYKNIEIIVVDDGSTDGTGDLIKEKYPMVRYVWQENRRIPAALNRGFKMAQGEFVCWLSDDDGINPDKTERQLKFMQENPELDLTFTAYEIRWQGDCEYTGQAGTVTRWQSKKFNNNYDEFCYCLGREICNANGSTSMFRRSAFRRMGYWVETLYTTQDWEMWLRYLHDGSVGLLDENLAWRIEHKDVSQGYLQGDPVARKRFVDEKNFVADMYRMKVYEGKRPRICAMLVVKNEEDMIERCLDDLILWVDEIVILDDGSTDKTPELIKQYPKVTNIYTQADKGNVRREADDRQRLLEMAQSTGCEWILFIDADEVFEDTMKARVYDMITEPNVNLYTFKEINFWRNETHYRVDELYDKGWFGRLFRNFPHLTIKGADEHCGGIPQNIPNCQPVHGYGKSNIQSDIGVKHYGFATYQRTVERAYRRWVRDPFRIDEHGEPRGGHHFYERMINETGLELKKYKTGIM